MPSCRSRPTRSEPRRDAACAPGRAAGRRAPGTPHVGASGAPLDHRLQRRPPEPPAVPEGRIELRPAPPLPPTEGAGGFLGNVVPTIGSIGTLVVLAAMGSSSTEGH